MKPLVTGSFRSLFLLAQCVSCSVLPLPPLVTMTHAVKVVHTVPDPHCIGSATPLPRSSQVAGKPGRLCRRRLDTHLSETGESERWIYGRSVSQSVRDLCGLCSCQNHTWSVTLRGSFFLSQTCNFKIDTIWILHLYRQCPPCYCNHPPSIGI